MHRTAQIFLAVSLILNAVLSGALFLTNHPLGEDLVDELLDSTESPTDIQDSSPYDFSNGEDTHEKSPEDLKKLPVHLSGIEAPIDFKETLSETWTQGESINVSYSFVDHYPLSESIYWDNRDQNNAVHMYSVTGWPAMYDDDTIEADLSTTNDATDDSKEDLLFTFQINALTSGTLYYNFRIDMWNTSSNAFLQATADSSSYLTDDFIDANGLITFNLRALCYLDNDYGYSWFFQAWNVSYEYPGGLTSIASENYLWPTWPSDPNQWTLIKFHLDEFRFVQDAITSQIRSEYRQTATSNNVQRRLTVPCHEYQSIINITLPTTTDLNSIEINPSVSYSTANGFLVLEDTIPADYEITFLTDDETRLVPASDVSKQVLYDPDFENGNEDWNTTGMSFSTAAPESKIVFSENLAYRFTDSDNNNDSITNEGSLAPDGKYFFNLEHFNVEFAGTGLVFSYYNNSWTDLSLNITQGIWIQEFFEIEIQGNDSGTNLRLTFHNASGDIVFDSFDFLTTNILPYTAGFDETQFVTQWRTWDGRRNPVAPERWVDLTFAKYPSLEAIASWDYTLTDEHGIVLFAWYARLQEETYIVISEFWDSDSAPTFNNGSVIFTPITTSQGGYSWEFYSGEDQDFDFSPVSLSKSIFFDFRDQRLLQDASYQTFEDQMIAVQDPTSNETIYLNSSAGDYQELLEARGQTHQHFYNQSSGSYTYQSSYAVQKTNVVPNSDWVTKEEFPVRFVVRNKAGNTVFCTLQELTQLFQSYDNASLWGVGIEGFGGITGFYLNFEDSINGHGQYLYYPRFANGCFSYDFPQYQIYPHLFANLSGTIYDNIFIPQSTARNRIYLENSSNVLKLYYTFQGTFLSRTFQFLRGIKYNITEGRFHFINHVVCLDQSFDDLGFAYEIDNTVYARETGYQTDRFLLRNETHSASLTVSQLWEAGTILEDFDSYIEIFSRNNGSFQFWFDDMEAAGFTKKYLRLHEREMPDGQTRKVLRVGMWGYGDYSAGTVIEIDPTYSEYQNTDDLDFSVTERLGAYTNTEGSQTIRIGYSSGDYQYRSVIAWDTGITSQIASTSSATLEGNVQTENVETGEDTKWGVYWNPTYGIWKESDVNSGNADEPYNQAYSGTPNADIDVFQGTGWKTITDADLGPIIDDWVTIHNVDPTGTDRDIVGFKVEQGSGMDYNTGDEVNIWESAGALYDPRLNFTYTLNTAPNAPTLNSDSGDVYAGKNFQIKIDYTDDNGASDLNSMYLHIDDDEGSNDIEMYCQQDWASSGTPTFTAGSGYVVMSPGPLYSKTTTGVTNGYRVTWSMILDYDWTEDDDDFRIQAYANDDGGENSGWHILDSNNYYENDIIVKSITYTANEFPNGIQEGGGTSINDEEWLKGGTSVTCSGVLSYQGATSVYPNTNAVDVELNVNGVNLGETYDDDTLGSSGEFSIVAYTVISSTDSDYDFNITLTDFLSSGSSANYDYSSSESQCSNGVHIDSGVDATAPGGASLTHSDADSDADGYSPQNGFDDDTTLEYSLSGATDAHAGLASSPYSYRFNGGSWGAWNTSTSINPSSTDGTTADTDAQVRDAVGNILTADGEDVTCDLSNPTITDSMSAYLESGDTTEVYGSIAANVFYFSDSFSSSAVVTFAATFTDTNVYAVDFGSFGGDNPAIDTSSPYQGQYTIDDSDGAGSISVIVVDQAGNIASGSITAIEDTEAPTAPSSFTCRPDSFTDSGDYDTDAEIYLTWSAASDSQAGLAGYYYDFNDSTPEAFTATANVTDVGLHGYLVAFFCQAEDNVGNLGIVVNDTISIDLISGTGSEYFSIGVMPGLPMSFSTDLSGIDWRLYREASLLLFWNGTEALEVSVYWRGSNLTTWPKFSSPYWQRLSFDLTGRLGSENYRGENGDLSFRFRNLNGSATDTVKIKWARLEYKTFDACSSDWSWNQPGYFEGWTNGSNSIADVGNSIFRVNATAQTDLLIYYNETVEAAEYDLISLECRASTNTTLQFQNGTNHIIGSFQVTQTWDTHLVWFNANWTNTQTDLILVWPNASVYAWFEINWLIQEQDTKISVEITEGYLRFHSQNNTLLTRVRIDGCLIGDFYDLEDIPLNTTLGLHYVEYIAWNSWQWPSNGFPVFLHARAYYFTYEITPPKVLRVHFDLADQMGIGLDWNTFQVFVNGSRIYGQDEVYENGSIFLQVEVRDFFNVSLLQKDVTVTKNQDIVLNVAVYSIIFENLGNFTSYVENYRNYNQGMNLTIPKGQKFIIRMAEGLYDYRVYYHPEEKQLPADTKSSAFYQGRKLHLAGTFKVSAKFPSVVDVSTPESTEEDKSLLDKGNDFLKGFLQATTLYSIGAAAAGALVMIAVKEGWVSVKVIGFKRAPEDSMIKPEWLENREDLSQEHYSRRKKRSSRWKW